MKEYLNLLSYPYEAEIKLKISDKMLTAMVKQNVKHPNIKDIRVTCHRGYLEVSIEASMFMLSKKFKIELELKQIKLTENQLIAVLSDHGNTLSVISTLLSLIGLKSFSMMTIQDGIITSDLSKQWVQFLNNQDVVVKKQLKNSQISKYSIIEGFVCLSIVNVCKGA